MEGINKQKISKEYLELKNNYKIKHDQNPKPQ